MKDLNLLADDLKDGTLTVYEGKALDPKPPVKIVIIGNIDAPIEFLKRRFRDKLDGAPGSNNGAALQKVDPAAAILIVDEDAMTIELKLDPENPYGAEITGRLEFTEHLKQFHINEPHSFKREDLMKLLRFSKPLFRDADKYEELMQAYQAFDWRSHIEAAQSGDSSTRGNRSIKMEKTVKSNLPESFILRLPIFKGKGPEEFRVDLMFDTTDASIRFWFESTELAGLVDQRKVEIFTESLQEFQDFVIIRK